MTQVLTCLQEDHESCPSTISLVIKQSKMDQERKGVTIVIGKTGDDICPVSALLSYLALRGARCFSGKMDLPDQNQNL